MGSPAGYLAYKGVEGGGGFREVILEGRSLEGEVIGRGGHWKGRYWAFG